MIGKIVYLDNNKAYYIIDELKYNNKLYVFCGEYLENVKDVVTTELCAFEADMSKDDVILKDINDDAIAHEVSKKFLGRLFQLNKTSK